MNNDGFFKIELPLENNVFQALSESVDFVSTGKGRLGNHLVDRTDKGVPIVRTTTRYDVPAHTFSSIHHNLVDEIKNEIERSDSDHLKSVHFNNALIEIYERNYTKMKYHSDQCMDIEENSYFGLYSCYERPEELTDQSTRKLKVKNRETDEENEILLTHNSVILFSFSTNSKFSHKIVLEVVRNKKRLEFDNRWLGVTFRQSKSLIQFKNNIPCFTDGEILKMANEEEQREFYKLRGQENNNVGFKYPKLHYTLSLADIMEPKEAK
jgi:hypothetical protein